MFLRRLMAALLIIAITLIVGSSAASAHTQTSVTQARTSHEVKQIPLPKKACDALLAYHPELASDPHGCDMTIITETQWLPTNSPMFSPLSCPGGTVNHAGTYYGPARLFGVTMRVTFSYPGNCGRPSVVSQNCMSTPYTYVPYNNLKNESCVHFAQDANAIAEGNYTVQEYVLGSISFWMQFVANAGNTNITENFS
jgi:hypothetical protein